VKFIIYFFLLCTVKQVTLPEDGLLRGNYPLSYGDEMML